jgi:hypothetical protein
MMRCAMTLRLSTGHRAHRVWRVALEHIQQIQPPCRGGLKEAGLRMRKEEGHRSGVWGTQRDRGCKKLCLRS